MRIYFHGNCQLPALSTLIAEVRPGWRLAAREVHTAVALTSRADVEADASEADAIIIQPIRRNYRDADFLSLEGVLARARTGCRIAVVPSMYFDGQLPCWGYLGVGPTRLRGHRMAYHCYPVAAMALAGLPADQIVDAVLAPDFLHRSDTEAAIEAALLSLRRREAEGRIDIPVSDIYAEACRRRQVGHTVNHPVRAVFAALANRILTHLGEAPDVPEDGPEPLPIPHIPLLPATAVHLGIPDGPDDAFRVGEVPRGRDYYFTHLVGYYRGLADGVLARALAGTREAQLWLSAYAAAHGPQGWTSVSAA